MAQRVRRDIFGRVDTRTPAQRAAYRYTAEEVAEIEKMDEASRLEGEREFFAEWTADITASRRVQWNELARDGAGITELEDTCGFSVYDLKQAVQHYA